MTIAWRHTSLRRALGPLIRRLASSDEESIITSLGTTTHIPAPHVERPKVSPLTELGSKAKEEEEEKEVITSLGSGESEPKTEKRKPRDRVIMWLGEKPEGIDEAYESEEAARKLRLEQAEEEKERKIRAASYPALEELPIELMPKSVRLLRPENVEKPLDLREAEEASEEYDNTVRIDICLLVDPRRSDEFVRGLSVLPHGTGRAPRIAVFAEGHHAQVAREANVEIVGGAELIQEVLESQGANVENIDKCIATPAMMAAGMSKLGKILGPRGLMPNPRAGTLTENVEETVKKLRQGQIEFRIDRQGNLRTPIGKISFGIEKLMENFIVYGSDVVRARPAVFQKKPLTKFLKKITISTNVGRGFPISVPSYTALLTYKAS